MKNEFWLDGVSCYDFGVRPCGLWSFDAPEPEVVKTSVPGRSGDLVQSLGRFKNVAGRVDCYAADSYSVAAVLAAANGWLLGAAGYRRLETGNDPGHFRLVRVVSGAACSIRMRIASFSIEADCKPQLYCKSGEDAVTLTSSGVLVNPEAFPARPLVRVYGVGTVTVGGYECRISSASGYTDLDCETMQAYNSGVSCNAKVWVPEFPVLKPGVNHVMLGSGITKVEITPRWWTV